MTKTDKKFKREFWEASKVKCDLCGYEWWAVRPDGLIKLECPHCHYVAYFENIKC